jgi:Mg2+ and Co2+ transporter CorA
MIWAYTIKSKKLRACDADSLDELEELSGKADWLWVDCLEPDDRELEIVAGLLRETNIIDAIKRKRIFSRYERKHDYTAVSIPIVLFESRLMVQPIYVFLNDKMFVTVRDKGSSGPIDNTLKTLQDCVSGIVCVSGVKAISSSFALSRLFHEATNENLDVIISFRERIDKVEERALANPRDKGISHSVFALKREISTFERTLWSQRELMLSMREGVVPTLQLNEEIVPTLNYAINNISRELSLLDSNNSALDSILNLQDLGMIHGVERTLIYLTLIILVANVILILLGLDILNLFTQ